jgi:hypothetical protein
VTRFIHLVSAEDQMIMKPGRAVSVDVRGDRSSGTYGIFGISGISGVFGTTPALPAGYGACLDRDKSEADPPVGQLRTP